MTAASECSEELYAFTWHWQTVRRSNTTERKYSLFPWHHPAKSGGRWREKRGHSWWQSQYHLLLTNSSCCFTYKLALLWTRVVDVPSPSHNIINPDKFDSFSLFKGIIWHFAKHTYTPQFKWGYNSCVSCECATIILGQVQLLAVGQEIHTQATTCHLYTSFFTD